MNNLKVLIDSESKIKPNAIQSLVKNYIKEQLNPSNNSEFKYVSNLINQYFEKLYNSEDFVDSGFSKDEIKNAFGHAFASGYFTYTKDANYAFALGYIKELMTKEQEIENQYIDKETGLVKRPYEEALQNAISDTNKDLWNNEKGIEYAKNLIDQGISIDGLAQSIMDNLKKGSQSDFAISNNDDRSCSGISKSPEIWDNVFKKFVPKVPSFVLGLLDRIFCPPAYGSEIRSASNENPEKHDPIILDLNNDGILETTDIKNGVYFDHENDGFAEASAWVGENDGILFSDNNNNNSLDNGSELITADNLTQFDTNGDGVIDANDDNFGNLKIIKGDGTILTLEEAGISSISASTNETDRIDENGNQQFADGTFTKTDGTTGEMGAFYFETETSESFSNEWLNETEDIEDLPDINGRGKLYSLHQAMLRNEELKNLVIAFKSETNDSIRQSLVEQILIKWADSNNIDAGSRGENINAQYLAILEKFMGKNFWSNYDAENNGENPSNPNVNAGDKLKTAYELLKLNIYAELMTQTHIADLFQQIEVEFDSEKQEFTFNLDAIKNTLLAAIAEDAESGKALAFQFIKALKGYGFDSCSNFFDPFNDDCLYTSLTKNDRDLKWKIDTIGKLSSVDTTGDGEGTAGDDTYFAEEDEDGAYHGLVGDDVIYGNNGKDSFYACSGDDIIDGGDGDDKIFAGDGNDIVFGGKGNDQIYGSSGDDIIFGGDGDDIIYPDRVDDANDYGFQNGNDIIRGDKGNDTIQFGAGITSDNVRFMRTSDNHLKISFPNNEDSIIIEDYFNDEIDHKIENFKFSDGTSLSNSEITISSEPTPVPKNGFVSKFSINNIIQEMSSYAPEGEMANGEYNQNNDELLQLVAC